MNTEKLSTEAENPALNKGAVVRCFFFGVHSKIKIINKIII